MHDSVRKLIRTVQSELYFLKEAKDAANLYGRRLLGVPHETEFYALDLIPDSLPGCFIDIGANQGQSIESIKLLKPRARIYAFEANRLLANKLQARYRGNADITIIANGLSDTSQQTSLFVPSYKRFVYDGLSSLEPEAVLSAFSPARLYWFQPNRLELMRVPCSIACLDEQNLDPLFIKIDVQGMESRVVRGALETIRRCEPILMIECVYDHPDLLEMLSEFGYSEYLFNEHGFFRGRSGVAVNQIMMTPRRAREVYLADEGRRAPAPARIPARVLARLRTEVQGST